MRIDKRGNLYTIAYVAVVVLVVGMSLALTSLSLKEKQTANVAADKMRQILASVHIPAGSDVMSAYKAHIIATPVYDEACNILGENAFDIDVMAEAAKPAAQRKLPLYVCRLDDGSFKYIIPLFGAGLWGPIWGYISLDADCSTVYGAYFDHQGETPGLGAEISKPVFSDQFDGKRMWKGGDFRPVTVVKAGMKPTGNIDYVDGISGGTITSKGVASMLDNCLGPYKAVLLKMQSK